MTVVRLTLSSNQYHSCVGVSCSVVAAPSNIYKNKRKYSGPGSNVMLQIANVQIQLQ